MRSKKLLRDINIVRTLSGLSPLQVVPITANHHGTGTFLVASACACEAGLGFHQRHSLRFSKPALAAEVAKALGQPVLTTEPEVRMTKVMHRLELAAFYGLIFVDSRGFLRRWIEPEKNPLRWKLQLIPTDAYPPGHDPYEIRRRRRDRR